MGLKSRIHWLLKSRKLSKVHIGFYASVRSYADDECLFTDHVCLYKNTTLYNVKIGRHSYLAGTSSQHSEIGKFCSIGPNTIVGGLGAHPTNQLSTHPIFYSTRKQSGETFVAEDYFQEHKNTIIGNDVWIGANSIILDGVTVGNGVIIAAGAVVTKNVPDYAIIGGIPAKIIRFRYPPQYIATLNKLQWWNKSDSELKNLASIFRENDLESLTKYLSIVTPT